MHMTNELENILKRRKERSETSGNDIAFISPLTSREKKEKIQDPIVTTVPIQTEMQMKYNPKGIDEEQQEEEEEEEQVYPKKENQKKDDDCQITKEEHANLKGRDRLNSIVSCLGESCPWTKTISSREMLGWLRSELDELEKELENLDIVIGKNVKDDGSASNIEFEKEDDTDEEGSYDLVDEKKELTSFLVESLTSEMGDILFDVLMLDMILKREYDIATNSTWNAANEKIERRTPYMKKWGDKKSTATTSDEATDIWLQVKAKETKNTFMQSILQKYIDQQKEKNEKESASTLSNDSDQVKPIEVDKSNKVENADEGSNDEIENVSSMEISDAKSEESTQAYPSDDSNILIHNEEDSKMSNVSFDVTVEDDYVRKNSSSLDELISEEEKKQLKPVMEKQDPTPILSKTAVYFVETLGLNNVMNGTTLSSATLGFAAGALVMALLQKIRSR